MESTKRLLWWMLAGSSGGANRGRIILLLRLRPYNAHQIALELGLDYKTVRHHLDVLLENSLVISRGEGYGKMYFLSPELEADFPLFEEIWAQIGKTQIKSANKDGDAG
jgi:DNA-binding transcriptional ArsR family regulator